MKIERMLIAVDFSDIATKAARYAIEAFAPDANVTLLHVIDPAHRPTFARDQLPPESELEPIVHDFAAVQMRELAAYLTSSRVRTDIRVGAPHEVVAAVATEIAADLVVIGPHGDPARPTGFLGSTADRIARTSPVPVLVVIEPAGHGPHHLLVPIDEDDAVNGVLEWTRALVGRFEAHVTMLHVWSNAVYSHVASMALATKSSEADARADIEQELNSAAAHWLSEVARTGIPRDRVDAIVAWGKPGDVAVETAARTQADLIVLGRRGAHLVASALLGSTVRTVLHGARCPVLVVTTR